MKAVLLALADESRRRGLRQGIALAARVVNGVLASRKDAAAREALREAVRAVEAALARETGRDRP